MRIADKYEQFNTIIDVWEPKYSTEEVYVACWKIDRSKLDIKLRFSKVNPTSDYWGDWFISRKRVVRLKKKYDNNGAECYVIPLSVLEKLQIKDSSMLEVW